MTPLLLRALAGESIDRPPVWMMRQAGRYLPEYQALRKKYSFFERCERTELITEITLQPVRRLGVDAAILFSDILVIPKAMGLKVEIIENKGPYLPLTIRSEKDLNHLHIPDPYEDLAYVLKGIKATKRALPTHVPLIGFAGAPWTIFCYMVEGKGSKGFETAKKFLITDNTTAHQLLHHITESTILYLKAQIKACVDAIQIFDSWAGLWDKEIFETQLLPHTQRIIEALAPSSIPVILFAKGAGYSLAAMQKTGAKALGIDWQTPTAYARKVTQHRITLQGNFDPSLLLLEDKALIQATRKMCQNFGTTRYIANLGHGILPHIPVEKAQLFVETIQTYEG